MNRRLAYVSVVILVSVAAAGVPSVAAATPTGIARTTLVSVSSTGVQGDLYSYAVAISARGRYVLFNSQATNLVADDTNERSDAFVRDRGTGRTTRVSVSSLGSQANAGSDPFGGSYAGGISAGGRYVVFQSDASNLVPNDTNGLEDIFVHDRRTGRTTRVNISTAGRQANGWSGSAVISADGRFVAFASAASDLVARDTNRVADVFVHNRRTGRTQRVSVTSGGRQGNGDAEEPALSAHGRYVAFATAGSNLVPRDTNGLEDIFVRDRWTGRTRRVSVTSGGGQGAGSATHSGSNSPAISADARFVAFHSDASNLVPGDTNGVFDIFVRDLATGQTRRVSVGNAGQQANAETLGPASISPDGRYVAFASLASNLVDHDLNGITDVFLRDRVAKTTILASVSSSGAQGNDASWPAAISADDRHLVFSSWAGDLVPTDASPGPDVFVRDLS
jgi:Tol biopolymer transport system component